MRCMILSTKSNPISMGGIPSKGVNVASVTRNINPQKIIV